MRIKIKIGACWLSGKYLGKHFRRRQYTEQVLLCNLHARYSCFWIIPAILLFYYFLFLSYQCWNISILSYWKMTKVTGKITVSSRVKEYPTIFYEDNGLLFCKFCCHSVDLNLVGETWHHDFKLAKQWLLLLNALFKKQINAERKIRWVHFQRQNAESKSKMPVIANFTRWTSWIKASITTKEGCICINPTWKQNMIKVMRIPIPEKSLSDFIELFELKQKPIAHQVYNIITNFQAVLEAGRTQVQFPDEIEAILSEANLANRSLADCLITYQSAFKIAS